MRRLLPFAVLGGCLVVGVLPALAANQDVGIRDFSFTPRNVAVLPGESVHWAVEPGYVGAMHNVHFDDQTDPLGPQSATFSGSRQFAVAGTYRYRCDVHPTVMSGTVYVNSTGTVPTPVADGLADGEPHRVADRDPDQPRWRLGWVGWRRWRGWGHSAGGGGRQLVPRARGERSARRLPDALARRRQDGAGARHAAAWQAARAQRHAARAAGAAQGPPAGQEAEAGPLLADAAGGRAQADRAVPRPAARLRRVAQQLWLLRHGEAVPHDSKPDDERELTARGERQSAAAGAALARLGVEFAAIYTSPKVRAQQTARLAAGTLNTEPEVEDVLAEGFDRADALELLDRHDADARVLVVGHDPAFTQVVYDLTGGRIDFKKGAVAAIRIQGREGRLIVLLRPRELESLAVTG